MDVNGTDSHVLFAEHLITVRALSESLTYTRLEPSLNVLPYMVYPVTENAGGPHSERINSL